jgi:hypothetical protein
MATINTDGRPAYMYDADTSTWYAISGRVSTNANYVWSGAHQYTNNVTMDGALTATLKFNSFLNPAARTAAIPSPGVGLLTFLQQDAGGNTINKFQYYNGSAWTDIPYVIYQASAPSSPSAGNVWVDSDNNTMYIYTGSAWVEIGGSGGITSSTFLLMGS